MLIMTGSSVTYDTFDQLNQEEIREVQSYCQLHGTENHPRDVSKLRDTGRRVLGIWEKNHRFLGYFDATRDDGGKEHGNVRPHNIVPPFVFVLLKHFVRIVNQESVHQPVGQLIEYRSRKVMLAVGMTQLLDQVAQPRNYHNWGYQSPLSSK